MRVIVMGYRRGRYFPLSVMTALSLLLAAVGDYLYEHLVAYAADIITTSKDVI